MHHVHGSGGLCSKLDSYSSLTPTRVYISKSYKDGGRLLSLHPLSAHMSGPWGLPFQGALSRSAKN
eukprot:9090658-Pyramimonas_sp.AAC.1